MKKTTCSECGMELTRGEGEYHPYSFCVMYRGGLAPWQTVADVVWAFGQRSLSAKILGRLRVRDAKLRAA